jgi:hypothetical protein
VLLLLLFTLACHVQGSTTNDCELLVGTACVLEEHPDEDGRLVVLELPAVSTSCASVVQHLQLSHVGAARLGGRLWSMSQVQVAAITCAPRTRKQQVLCFCCCCCCWMEGGSLVLLPLAWASQELVSVG